MSQNTGWSVTIDAVVKAPLTEDQVDNMVDLLDAVVSLSPDGLRVSSTIDVLEKSARILPEAVTAAGNRVMDAVAKAGGIVRDIVHVEGMRFMELDRRLEEPAFPVLAGVAELAERLDVSKQRIVALAKRRDFPAPVAVLHSGPVWRLDDVSRFESTWERRSGRPRTAEVARRNSTGRRKLEVKRGRVATGRT